MTSRLSKNLMMGFVFGMVMTTKCMKLVYTYITFVSTSYFLLTIVGSFNVLKATTHWNSYDMRAILGAKLVKDIVVQEVIYFGCIFMCLNIWNVIILSCVALFVSIFNLCVCVPFVLSMLQS
jgi:hypothetical protein